MTQKFSNAARAELASTINDTDTTLTIVEGGSLFPVANTDTASIGDSLDWFKLVIQDLDNYEIVYVRTHTVSSTTFSNVLRGQEGTTAHNFASGSVVGLRPTAGDSEAFLAALGTKLEDAPSDGKTYGRKDAAWAEAAPLASPTFTGTPAAPTAAVGTNTTQLATTAHVFAERAATATLTNKTLTTPLITGTREIRVAMPANAIDLATGNLFTKTISGATTFTVSNVPATGTAASFILELTNAGSAAITWFSGVKWAGGTAPTLTASGVDVLGFYTHNGGSTWRGMLLAKDSK